MADPVLTGLDVSVYTRIVRMALAEKGLSYRFEPADPFAATPDPVLARLTPFNRVPVLTHDGFCVYETSAILRYLEAAFPSPPLVPADARAAARVAQVIAIADSYGYRPLVRQVFAHRVFRPLEGLPADEDAVAEGLAAAAPVLGALERIADEGRVLNSPGVTLADIHLAPMIDYFAMTPEGAEMLGRFTCLNRWFARIKARRAFIGTAVELPMRDSGAR